jgi:phage tail-like protein
MAIGERRDPVLSHNFEISLLESTSTLGQLLSVAVSVGVVGAPVGGFSECSGLQLSLDIEEYQEGGNNGTVLKFPTRIKQNNITLKKGVGRGSALWDWFDEYTRGRGRRRDGLIVLRNEQREPHSLWSFRRGLPLRWEGPAMNASQSAVAIETIEIAHEGLYRVAAG